MAWEGLPTLQTLHEWVGYVLEFRKSDFLARLIDLSTRPSHEKEEAIFSMKELLDNAVSLCVDSMFDNGDAIANRRHLFNNKCEVWSFSPGNNPSLLHLNLDLN